MNSLKKKINRNKISENLALVLFFLCACISIFSIIAIFYFIIVNGLPTFEIISIKDFLFGDKWKPTSEPQLFGIFPMIIGSLSLTFFSALIGIPIGVLTGVFMAEYANDKIKRILSPAIELLAGIPSVVYGFFGLIVFVPIVNNLLGGRGGGSSLLSGIIVLVIMILPIIVTTTKTALEAVPKEFKEGSIALGASKEHTIIKVSMPSAKSGILAGIILSMGRAIGETMAIILVTGNTPIIPNFINNFERSMTDPIRTLTANIALEMSYANGVHSNALFATGIVLLIFIMILNLLLNFIKKGSGE